jgi:hypothetical protein
MDLPTQTPRDADAPDDGGVAHAIDRVLDAEHIAQAAIADCEKQGLESLEQARQQRRSILERAQQRVVALHIRAARALEQRVAQVREPHGRTVAGTMAPEIDHTRVQAAINKLADRLIGNGDEGI